MRTFRFLPFAALVLAVAALLPAAAEAATFNVSPTQVFLTGRETSSLLTLRNESDEPLRFQLSAFAWDQSPAGEMILTPTEDVVFFPALVTLGPKEERKVRIGRIVTPSNVERTYRLFVEELPSLDAVANPGSSVKVLTKMGIPIFVRPGREVTTATVTEPATADGALHFALANSGTVHFVPERVVVRGIAADKTVFEKALQGWYVLAGGRREFELALSEPACAGATALQIEAVVGTTRLDQRIDIPVGACRP